MLQMAENAVMCKMTGAAALHVVLLRVVFAQDAFEVFGWKAETVFTYGDLNARFDELAKSLNGEQLKGSAWKARPKAVRKALFPVVLGALWRIRWAMNVIDERLSEMEDQNEAETDAE